MSFLHRKHCCLLPPGWSPTLRRLLSLLAAILRELTTDSIKPSFSPWRSCSAQNSAHRRLVFSSCSWFTVWRQHVLHNFTWRPQESVLTLRHLWASGYQVILSYDSETAVGHQELWPAVPYWWANQRTAQDVISYLDCKKDLGRPGWVYTLAHIFSVILVLSHTKFNSFFFCQRASLSVAWTWRLIGITSPRTWSSPCGRWPSVIGSVWRNGWRSRDPGQTPRASTSLQETLWVHFLSALWSSHWTKNF